MDALPIEEATRRCPTPRRTPGRMHACGHDGHTTMLLGAARYLAETRNFDGTVYFIFQPAEEMQAGGRVMVEEGLLERFPAEQVFGLHNWPRLPLGQFAMRPGPVMAAADRFEIRAHGQGGHGAMPHHARDPVVAGAQIVSALQTIVARNVDPIDRAVVSVTQFHAGDAYNVIPQTAMLGGTARSFTPADARPARAAGRRDRPRASLRRWSVEAEVTYERGYPATVNSEAETELAAAAAVAVVGEDKVDRAPTPVMGAEDFAFMLEQRPGSYIFIGNGGGDDAPMVHHPAVRLQRRGAALRRQLLGQAGRAAPARPLTRRAAVVGLLRNVRWRLILRIGPVTIAQRRRSKLRSGGSREPAGQASLVRARSRGRADHRLCDVAGRRGGAARPDAVTVARRDLRSQLGSTGGFGSRAAELRTRTLSMRRPSMSTTSNRQPP